jgi:RNA polymerase sigma-54 factor
MGYDAKLSLKQAPALGLNAAVLQTLKLLPLARMDLIQVIQEELVENPMLEEVTVEADGDTPAEEEDAQSPVDCTADHVADGQEWSDVNWAQYVPEEWEWHGLSSEAYGAPLSYENTACTPTTLQEHLIMQLLTATGDKVERRVGAFLIGNIDEEGYLRCDLEEAMAATGADLATVERIVATLQAFEPTGVGARDLRECLLIQIRALGLEGSRLETIVSDYLHNIESRRLAHSVDLAQELTKRLRLSAEELAMALRILRHLDPKPGLRLAGERSEAIVPDVIVRKVGHDYQVWLNDEGIPRLHISATYKRMLREGQAKQYLAEKLRAAVGLIRSIEQRRQTIYKVATSIVKFQREFFERGLASLKPLVLKDVAEDIGMHESTVSRVTTSKYMDTEQGLFALKYFFHSGLEAHGGETMSSLTVKDRIKKLVAAEDPMKALTDQHIVDMLAAEDIKIARRTVAKYRHELKLSTAKRRKRIHEVQGNHES